MDPKPQKQCILELDGQIGQRQQEEEEEEEEEQYRHSLGNAALSNVHERLFSLLWHKKHQQIGDVNPIWEQHAG